MDIQLDNVNLLVVDLSSKDIYTESICPQIIRKFYGGLGLNTWLLYKYTGPETDPFGPENVIIFSPGLLTATQAPTSSRVEVTTKSPLTGLIGTGNSGGHWGPRLRKGGISSILVKGASNWPLVLVVDEGSVSLDTAETLWGKDTYETTDLLLKELGPEYSIMTIGPAGENLVRFAAPVFDKQHMPGRCHAGGVLGSKKLKAVAVKGSPKPRPQKPRDFKEAVSECEARIRAYPAWKARATAGSMGTIGLTSEGVDYDDLVTPYLKRGEPGVYCPCMMESLYGCSLLTDIKEGPYKGTEVACAGLTLYSGAASRFNISLPAAFFVNDLCQRYGMDMFGPFFYVYDLYDKGVITETDLGFRLEPGDEEALLSLLRMVAYRQGFGDLLAEGSVRTAEALGGDADKYVPAVKGMELMYRNPQVDLEGNVFTSLSILTNPRGGDDLKGTHGVSTYPGLASWALKLGIPSDQYSKWLIDWLDMPHDFKIQLFGDPPDISKPDHVLMTIWYNHLTSVYNSLGLCMFACSVAEALGPTYMAKLYSAATGIQTTPEEIMETGERVFNLMRLYIIREGVNKKDDQWPSVYVDESSKATSTFSAVETIRYLERYYRIRGWDPNTGKPLPETLEKLDLKSHL